MAIASARPQFLGGQGAGFGTGNAGPLGVGSTGVATSNALPGGFSASTGQGLAANTPFGQQVAGTGNSVSGGGLGGGLGGGFGGAPLGGGQVGSGMFCVACKCSQRYIYMFSVLINYLL